MTAWQVYRQPRLILILLMGFASGLPLALIGATLGMRLAEAGVSLTLIGTLALVQLSYNFKVFWAPFLDFGNIPFATVALGRRRSWLLLIQLCLGAALLALGQADPSRHLVVTAAWAVLAAFLSASQDIVIDAFRVELLTPDEQGSGAAAAQMGFRTGMIVSGAGTLYLATAYGWNVAYEITTCFLTIGAVAVLAAPRLEIRHGEKPEGFAALTRLLAQLGWKISLPLFCWLLFYVGHLLLPIAEISDLGPQHFAGFSEIDRALILGAVCAGIALIVAVIYRVGKLRALVLLFIVLFNLGTAVAGHMANTFYLQTGFSKDEIATISKIIGVVATMAGVGVGGILVYRLGVLRSLFFGGIAQLVSTLLYVLQAVVGRDIHILACTVSVENFATGLASSAFVALLSNLSDRRSTATQFALFSGLALLGRNLFAASSGGLAQALGWKLFFVSATGLGLPAMIILLVLLKAKQIPMPLFDGIGIEQD